MHNKNIKIKGLKHITRNKQRNQINTLSPHNSTPRGYEVSRKGKGKEAYLRDPKTPDTADAATSKRGVWEVGAKI